jgi:hypothetical protein
VLHILLRSSKHYACILMNGFYIFCKSNTFVFSPSHSPRSFYFQGFWKSYLFFWHELHNFGSISLPKKSINTHLNFPNYFYFHFCHLQHILFLLLSSFLPLLPFFRNWKGHNMNFFISFVVKMCAWCSPFFLPISYFSFMKHAFHSIEELHKCGRQMKTTCSFEQPLFGDML